MTNTNELSQLEMIKDIHEDVREIRKDLKKKADKKEINKLEDRVRATEKDSIKVKTVVSLIVFLLLGLTALGAYL